MIEYSNFFVVAERKSKSNQRNNKCLRGQLKLTIHYQRDTFIVSILCVIRLQLFMYGLFLIFVLLLSGHGSSCERAPVDGQQSRTVNLRQGISAP